MTEGPIHAAVDLGASSGRVVAGRRAGGRVVLEEVHRFANRPVRLPDGLHWSLPELFGHALDGIGAAAARGPLAGVGVDAWGVDYALLDGAGSMLGLPWSRAIWLTAAACIFKSLRPARGAGSSVSSSTGDGAKWGSDPSRKSASQWPEIWPLRSARWRRRVRGPHCRA